MITAAKLDVYFKRVLDIESFSSIDTSLNGLQVDNDGGEIGKIAFAVDACVETFERAAAAGAGMLFAHHGLFWGKPLALRGNHKRRIAFLLEHNLALYAVHLPLDQHSELGNNAAVASLLGIEEKEPFGLYHGKKIGYKGRLKEPLSAGEAARRIGFMGREPLGVYPFGKEKNESCAVVTGGAASLALQAMDEGLDLYVTGESSHQIYHEILEGRVNMVAGGHYATEIWGVRKMMERCAEELHIDVEFIDAPTGL